MKISLDIGHNCRPDTGAVGIKKEDDLVNYVGDYLIEMLRDVGHQIVFTKPQSAVTVNDSLNQRIRKANKSKSDIFVSVHFNAFSKESANGTEVWIYSPGSALKDEAHFITQNIAKLGYRNRGVKCGNFSVLRRTDMPALLIECCFITSTKDMKLFNPKDMAIAIFRGLMKNEVTPPIEQELTSEHGKLIVNHKTLLKPSTEQSVHIDKSELVNIDIGEYSVDLLADEEGHYLVLFTDGEFEDRRLYIYSGHCEIK